MIYDIEVGKKYAITHKMRGDMVIKVTHTEGEHVLGVVVVNHNIPAVRSGIQFCYTLPFITSIKEVEDE